MTEAEKKSLTLRIGAETHKQLKILSALRDQTMTQVIEELVEEAYKAAMKQEAEKK